MISHPAIRHFSSSALEPRNEVYCGKCRYDVRGNPGTVCPECGCDLLEVGVFHRTSSEFWAMRLAGLYLGTAIVLPTLLILLLLRYACPAVVGEDYTGGAQYRLGVVPWEANASVVVLYEGRARKLVWRLPLATTISHPGPDDELRVQFVEPQGSLESPSRRESQPIRLHVSEGGIEVVGEPKMTTLQIEDLFAAQLSAVSMLPPWEVQRAAEQLVESIRRSASTDNRLWLLTMDRTSPERATTYVWSLGFTGSQTYDHVIYWPMALAVLLIPAAWWLLLGYLPARHPRLKGHAPAVPD